MKRRGFFGLLLAPLLAPIISRLPDPWNRKRAYFGFHGQSRATYPVLEASVSPTEFRGSFKLTEIVDLDQVPTPWSELLAKQMEQTTRDMAKYLDGLYPKPWWRRWLG